MKILSLFFILIFISCTNNKQEKEKEESITDSFKTKRRTVQTPKLISDSTNTLEPQIRTLELEYIDWLCACANWITPSDKKKFENKGLAKHCIFIEPADSTLNLPNGLTENIKVTGQFYVREDYPKGYTEIEEPLDKAKVFRYTRVQILEKYKRKR